MYCTRHIDPDFRVTYETHDTYGQAVEYAHEVVNEDGSGGEVEIYFRQQTVWPQEDRPSLSQYNGVRAGFDFPATL